MSIFRRPESRNARITMVVMALILGSLVLGVSLLASVTHPVPYESGTPTVISQIAKFVYGTSGLGNVFYGMLQVGTMLILILAANTSFTGFPFLASFAAEDSYLPRQLTKRGHRLVFSTGIIVLTVVSIVLLWITNAKVDKLIPLYAIGVFTGFTMAGAGMAKYHLNHREDHWRRRLVINGTAAVLSFIVLIIIAVSKFTEGAWVILIILPVGVLALLALHRQYADEEQQLEVGAAEAAEAPVLNRHSVIVLVDRLDMATARALQYARTLHPDELRAVHFTLDSRVSAELESEWGRLGLTRLPLDVEECEDRRLTRAALELAAETVADGQTELTILLPRRGFAAGWHRLLHDATADEIAAAVGQLAHVNATVVPYQLTGGWLSRRREWRRVPVVADTRPTAGTTRPPPGPPPGRPPGRPSGRRPEALSTGPPSASGRGHHPDRRGPVAAPGAGGGPGQVGTGPAPGRDVQPRVRAGRRDRPAAAGLPGPTTDPRDPARGPAGGRGHGGGLGPSPGHPQPRLRADRRSRGRRRAVLTGGPDGHPGRPGRAGGGPAPGASLLRRPFCKYLSPRCRKRRAGTARPGVRPPGRGLAGGRCVLTPAMGRGRECRPRCPP